MIAIRPLQTLDELHQCEELQKQVWGFEDIAVVPHHLLLTTIKNGGVLLGAFAHNNSQQSRGEAFCENASPLLVGFVYGFPGLEDNRLKHCSLMCAVLSEHRFQGLGYQLKLKQREAVLAQNIELITWTFDPLVSSNAYFNLHKLGVISNCYERNLYGDMRDRLNAGLETDRLTVAWWIASARVRTRLDPHPGTFRCDRFLKLMLHLNVPPAPSPCQGEGKIEPINATEWRGDLLVPRDYRLKANESRLCLEIPYHWREMRERDMELTKEWRRVTRAILENYFARGYFATDFWVSVRVGKQCAFYLLERKSKTALLGS